MKPSVGIVGIGVVGSALAKIFDWAVCYDKYLPAYNSDESKALVGGMDIAFVCVPTPTKDEKCDISAVVDVVTWLNSDIVVIKSTVPVGTTSNLTKLTGKQICFSPEYQGATQHSHPESSFVVLGGERSVTKKVAQLYQYIYSGDIHIVQTDAKTAELVKYMENAFLATKVVFCNEFYRIAEAIGIDYTELRELFLLDSRVARSHTFVYEKQPYYDSSCLNKDLAALVSFASAFGYEPRFVKRVIETNMEYNDD